MVKLVKPVQEKNECHYDKTKIEVELEHAWKDEPLVEKSFESAIIWKFSPIVWKAHCKDLFVKGF